MLVPSSRPGPPLADPALRQGHPFLTAAARPGWSSRRCVLVGIDSSTSTAPTICRPAHIALFAAGVPIVEHLTGLEQLLRPPDSALHAPPAAVVGLGSWPVRAYALITGPR